MKKHPLIIKYLIVTTSAIASLCSAVLLAGCAPRVYRVTFQNGTYDYYELDYRPAPDAKIIEYQGETIMGVEKLEKINL